MIKPIPEGYHSITPYLIFQGAEDAIDFYKRAFGAVEISRMTGPNGRMRIFMLPSDHESPVGRHPGGE